jgi:hypothetical protein
LLVAAGAAVVVVVFAVVRWNQPDLVPLGPPPMGAAGLTLAGGVALEPATPAAREPVTARVTVSADRHVVLRALVVKVRDEAGTFHDFPELANVELDTGSRQVVASRAFDAPGDYTYYLAYRLDGDWVSLPPWHTVTVR